MAETSKTLKNGERLPSELKEEIFSKLSVKDILRSRSVCKPWKTLIDSHGFKKKLFEAAKRSHSFIIWRKSFSALAPTLQILYHPFDNVSPPLELNLGQFLDGSVFNSSDIMIVSSGDNNADDLDFKKFGVVNGLVCLGWNSFHVVLNPYTKESKLFNAPKKNWVFDLLDNSGINDDVVLNDQLCAFGYDPIGEDYKFLIAHFTSNLTNKGSKNKVLFQLYSVRNNTWRGAILDFPFIDGIETGDGFMDDGKFYWFVKKCGKKKEDGSFSPAVIVFDFGNEVFDVITLPVELARGEDTIAVANRGVLEIIMTIDDGKDDEEGCSISEVWVMGKDGSWSRTSSVDLPCKVGRPIGVLKNGEMMFEKPSKVDGVKDLVLINPANGSFKKIDINGTELWMFNYVQSLFSVKQ